MSDAHIINAPQHLPFMLVKVVCLRRPVPMQDAQKRPEGPQKVIVFSTFVQALHLMADTLAENKLGFVMLHGQMTLDERSQVCS